MPKHLSNTSLATHEYIPIQYGNNSDLSCLKEFLAIKLHSQFLFKVNAPFNP